ncbi:MAG: FecR domain-containing protein [Sphingomonas sp.]
MSPTEAAAHWVVLRDARALSAREEIEFDAWQDDPTHAEALRKAGGAMALFDHDLGSDPNLRALRQAALDAAPAPRRRYGLAIGGAMAASLAIAVTLFGLERPNPGANAPGRSSAVTGTIAATDPARDAAAKNEYVTGVGERRTVRLADGTSVTLNTRSRLIVAFTEGRRFVRLTRGQALFEVAHDRNRPFTVEAADRQITALGTVFEVRVDPGRVNVVLFQGRVVVDRAPEAANGYEATPVPPSFLKPGEQFSAEMGTAQKVGAVDVDRQLLWRDGFVEFDDEPLGHAVAEINRYASRPITLSNDGVAALHVSGLYRTGSPDQFVDAVQGILPVEAKPTAQGGIELSLAARGRP